MDSSINRGSKPTLADEEDDLGLQHNSNKDVLNLVEDAVKGMIERERFSSTNVGTANLDSEDIELEESVNAAIFGDTRDNSKCSSKPIGVAHNVQFNLSRYRLATPEELGVSNGIVEISVNDCETLRKEDIGSNESTTDPDAVSSEEVLNELESRGNLEHFPATSFNDSMKSGYGTPEVHLPKKMSPFLKVKNGGILFKQPQISNNLDNTDIVSSPNTTPKLSNISSDSLKYFYESAPSALEGNGKNGDISFKRSKQPIVAGDLIKPETISSPKHSPKLSNSSLGLLKCFYESVASNLDDDDDNNENSHSYSNSLDEDKMPVLKHYKETDVRPSNEERPPPRLVPQTYLVPEQVIGVVHPFNHEKAPNEDKQQKVVLGNNRKPFNPPTEIITMNRLRSHCLDSVTNGPRSMIKKPESDRTLILNHETSKTKAVSVLNGFLDRCSELKKSEIIGNETNICQGISSGNHFRAHYKGIKRFPAEDQKEVINVNECPPLDSKVPLVIQNYCPNVPEKLFSYIDKCGLNDNVNGGLLQKVHKPVLENNENSNCNEEKRNNDKSNKYTQIHNVLSINTELSSTNKETLNGTCNIDFPSLPILMSPTREEFDTSYQRKKGNASKKTVIKDASKKRKSTCSTATRLRSFQRLPVTELTQSIVTPIKKTASKVVKHPLQKKGMATKSISNKETNVRKEPVLKQIKSNLPDSCLTEELKNQSDIDSKSSLNQSSLEKKECSAKSLMKDDNENHPENGIVKDVPSLDLISLPLETLTIETKESEGSFKTFDTLLNDLELVEMHINPIEESVVSPDPFFKDIPSTTEILLPGADILDCSPTDKEIIISSNDVEIKNGDVEEVQVPCLEEGTFSTILTYLDKDLSSNKTGPNQHNETLNLEKFDYPLTFPKNGNRDIENSDLATKSISGLRTLNDVADNLQKNLDSLLNDKSSTQNLDCNNCSNIKIEKHGCNIKIPDKISSFNEPIKTKDEDHKCNLYSQIEKIDQILDRELAKTLDEEKSENINLSLANTANTSNIQIDSHESKDKIDSSTSVIIENNSSILSEPVVCKPGSIEENKSGPNLIGVNLVMPNPNDQIEVEINGDSSSRYIRNRFSSRDPRIERNRNSLRDPNIERYRISSRFTWVGRSRVSSRYSWITRSRAGIRDTRNERNRYGDRYTWIPRNRVDSRETRNERYRDRDRYRSMERNRNSSRDSRIERNKDTSRDTSSNTNNNLKDEGMDRNQINNHHQKNYDPNKCNYIPIKTDSSWKTLLNTASSSGISLMDREVHKIPRGSKFKTFSNDSFSFNKQLPKKKKRKKRKRTRVNKKQKYLNRIQRMAKSVSSSSNVSSSNCFGKLGSKAVSIAANSTGINITSADIKSEITSKYEAPVQDHSNNVQPQCQVVVEVNSFHTNNSQQSFVEESQFYQVDTVYEKPRDHSNVTLPSLHEPDVAKDVIGNCSISNESVVQAVQISNLDSSKSNINLGEESSSKKVNHITKSPRRTTKNQETKDKKTGLEDIIKKLILKSEMENDSLKGLNVSVPGEREKPPISSEVEGTRNDLNPLLLKDPFIDNVPDKHNHNKFMKCKERSDGDNTLSYEPKNNDITEESLGGNILSNKIDDSIDRDELVKNQSKSLNNCSSEIAEGIINFILTSVFEKGQTRSKLVEHQTNSDDMNNEATVLEEEIQLGCNNTSGIDENQLSNERKENIVSFAVSSEDEKLAPSSKSQVLCTNREEMSDHPLTKSTEQSPTKVTSSSTSTLDFVNVTYPNTMHVEESIPTGSIIQEQSSDPKHLSSAIENLCNSHDTSTKNEEACTSHSDNNTTKNLLIFNSDITLNDSQVDLSITNTPTVSNRDLDLHSSSREGSEIPVGGTAHQNFETELNPISLLKDPSIENVPDKDKHNQFIKCEERSDCDNTLSSESKNNENTEESLGGNILSNKIDDPIDRGDELVKNQSRSPNDCSIEIAEGIINFILTSVIENCQTRPKLVEHRTNSDDMNNEATVLEEEIQLGRNNTSEIDENQLSNKRKENVVSFTASSEDDKLAPSSKSQVLCSNHEEMSDHSLTKSITVTNPNTLLLEEGVPTGSIIQDQSSDSKHLSSAVENQGNSHDTSSKKVDACTSHSDNNSKSLLIINSAIHLNDNQVDPSVTNTPAVSNSIVESLNSIRDLDLDSPGREGSEMTVEETAHQNCETDSSLAPSIQNNLSSSRLGKAESTGNNIDSSFPPINDDHQLSAANKGYDQDQEDRVERSETEGNHINSPQPVNSSDTDETSDNIINEPSSSDDMIFETQLLKHDTKTVNERKNFEHAETDLIRSSKNGKRPESTKTGEELQITNSSDCSEQIRTISTEPSILINSSSIETIKNSETLKKSNETITSSEEQSMIDEEIGDSQVMKERSEGISNEEISDSCAISDRSDIVVHSKKLSKTNIDIVINKDNESNISCAHFSSTDNQGTKDKVFNETTSNTNIREHFSEKSNTAVVSKTQDDKSTNEIIIDSPATDQNPKKVTSSPTSALDYVNLTEPNTVHVEESTPTDSIIQEQSSDSKNLNSTVENKGNSHDTSKIKEHTCTSHSDNNTKSLLIVNSVLPLNDNQEPSTSNETLIVNANPDCDNTLSYESKNNENAEESVGGNILSNKIDDAIDKVDEELVKNQSKSPIDCSTEVAECIINFILTSVIENCQTRPKLAKHRTNSDDMNNEATVLEEEIQLGRNNTSEIDENQLSNERKENIVSFTASSGDDRLAPSSNSQVLCSNREEMSDQSLTKSITVTNPNTLHVKEGVPTGSIIQDQSSDSKHLSSAVENQGSSHDTSSKKVDACTSHSDNNSKSLLIINSAIHLNDNQVDPSVTNTPAVSNSIVESLSSIRDLDFHSSSREGSELTVEGTAHQNCETDSSLTPFIQTSLSSSRSGKAESTGNNIDSSFPPINDDHQLSAANKGCDQENRNNIASYAIINNLLQSNDVMKRCDSRVMIYEKSGTSDSTADKKFNNDTKNLSPAPSLADLPVMNNNHKGLLNESNVNGGVSCNESKGDRGDDPTTSSLSTEDLVKRYKLKELKIVLEKHDESSRKILGMNHGVKRRYSSDQLEVPERKIFHRQLSKPNLDKLKANDENLVKPKINLRRIKDKFQTTIRRPETRNAVKTREQSEIVTNEMNVLENCFVKVLNLSSISDVYECLQKNNIKKGGFPKNVFKAYKKKNKPLSSHYPGIVIDCFSSYRQRRRYKRRRSKSYSSGDDDEYLPYRQTPRTRPMKRMNRNQKSIGIKPDKEPSQSTVHEILDRVVEQTTTHSSFLLSQPRRKRPVDLEAQSNTLAKRRNLRENNIPNSEWNRKKPLKVYTPGGESQEEGTASTMDHASDPSTSHGSAKNLDEVNLRKHFMITLKNRINQMVFTDGDSDEDFLGFEDLLEFEDNRRSSCTSSDTSTPYSYKDHCFIGRLEKWWHENRTIVECPKNSCGKKTFRNFRDSNRKMSVEQESEICNKSVKSLQESSGKPFHDPGICFLSVGARSAVEKPVEEENCTNNQNSFSGLSTQIAVTSKNVEVVKVGITSPGEHSETRIFPESNKDEIGEEDPGSSS